jgi:hypothetical protein
MPKEYSPTPYEKRPSVELGAVDYLKHVGYYTGLPLLSGAIGVALGVISGNKLPYLNGKAPLVNRFYNRMIAKMHNRDVSTIESAPHFEPLWNFVKGSLPVSLMTTFQKWRADEQKIFDITDIYADLVEISPRVQTQEKLEEDNWILKRQLAHKKSKIMAETSEDDGYISSKMDVQKIN